MTSRTATITCDLCTKQLSVDEAYHEEEHLPLMDWMIIRYFIPGKVLGTTYGQNSLAYMHICPGCFKKPISTIKKAADKLIAELPIS